MFKPTRQEFSIKVCPSDEITLLENTLNSMSKEGWDLYSIYESDNGSKIVYNCLFVREVENIYDEAEFEDILGFKSQMEKMLYSKEQPWELCLNIQKKIREKRQKIEEIKKFLENAKDDEREFLNEEISREIDKLNNLKKQLKSLLSPSKMAQNLGVEKLSINLSEELYCLNDAQNMHNLLEQTIKARQDLTFDLGYIIPKVQFVENPELDEYAFTISIHAVPVIEAKAYPNHLMYVEDELNIDKFPKNTIKAKDELSGRKVVWIEENACKDFWVKGITPCEYVVEYLKHFAITNVSEIFSYSDINRYIELVSEHNSFLIDSILGDFISVGELKYIFCNLIRERVSVKDVDFIFEKINDFSDESTKADLLDKLRVALSRQICHSLANEDNQIFGYEVSNELISMLESQSEDEQNGVVKIDGTKFSKFKKELKQVLEQKAVLVAPQHLRQLLFVLISQIYTDIPVICLEEVANEFELKILGQV